MHYAYGQRKTAHNASAAAYTPRQSRTSIVNSIRRRVRLRTLAAASATFFLFYLFLSWLFTGGSRSRGRALPTVEPIMTKAPSGQPNVVLVTVIDEERGTAYNEAVKKNRDDYAKRHGYATFYPLVTEYNVGDAPRSWAKVPALRHALTQHPQTPFFLFLDDHTLIANPSLSVEEHLTAKTRVESLAITDVPVVPPDSVIKTLKDVPGHKVDFLLVQDKEGLSVNSFLLRNGEWAKYFLDAWFDPLYRSYNFQKAERHALEHIVQWHTTLLAKLALVPQDTLSSYTEKDQSAATGVGLWKEGNFIVSFGDCDAQGRSCADEMRDWLKARGAES